ncbi:MAG: membrane dipeptidase, partial [Bacteroidota bacterium]
MRFAYLLVPLLLAACSSTPPPAPVPPPPALVPEADTPVEAPVEAILPAPPPRATPPDPEAAALLSRARALAQDALIVDGHIDVPYRLHQSGDDVGDATEAGDFDYPRAIAGGLNAPFLSVYVPAHYQETGGAKAFADSLIDLVEGLTEAHPDKFRIARSPAEVRANTAAGLISLPLGMENGAPIEGDLANLEHFHSRGIRYITLTHGRDNEISDSSYDDAGTHGGLSDF